MLFSMENGRGIKKKTLPQPNPRKVEFSRQSTLEDIFAKANTLYFENKASSEDMHLAHSNGYLMDINTTAFTLEQYKSVSTK